MLQQIGLPKFGSLVGAMYFHQYEFRCSGIYCFDMGVQFGQRSEEKCHTPVLQSS